MRNERLLKVIGDVDEELIWQAEHLIPEAPKPALSWKLWTRVAVSFILVVAIGLGVRNAMGDRKKDSTMDAFYESSEESFAEDSRAEGNLAAEAPAAEEEKETPAEEEAFAEEKAEEEAAVEEEEAPQEAEPREDEAEADVAAEEAETDEEEAYRISETSDDTLALTEEPDGSLTLTFAEGDPVKITAWYVPGTPDSIPFEGEWTALAAEGTTLHLPKNVEAGWIMVEATWPDDRIETYYKYYEER